MIVAAIASITGLPAVSVYHYVFTRGTDKGIDVTSQSQAKEKEPEAVYGKEEIPKSTLSPVITRKQIYKKSSARISPEVKSYEEEHMKLIRELHSAPADAADAKLSKD